jgi:hypothetical protein
MGTLTANSTQVTGLTAATPGTEFAFGDLASFTIAASAGAGGTIAPSGSVSVPANGSQAFTISANAGFSIADVLVDGGSVGAVTNFSFTNVTTNHTIAASFNGVARTLTLTVIGVGSITKTPDQATYLNGSTVQLTAVPASGWAFSAWSGALTGNTNPGSLLMDANKSVTSTFTDAQAPAVAVTSPNGGEVLNVAAGTSLTWTATDNTSVKNVDLDLSRSGTGGPFESIATGIANSGSFTWTVTGPTTTNAFLRVTARDSTGNSAQDLSNAGFAIASGEGVADGPITDFALAPVWPNPVRGSTRFAIALPKDASVHLGIHDVQGRELLVLADGPLPAGRHSFDWTTSARTHLDPGLYFVRFTVPGRTFVQRFALVR